MTAFYKFVVNGYLEGVGTNGGDDVDAITEPEFDALKTLICSKPEAPSGYVYRLRADTLEWELVEEPDEADDAEALEILFGGEA